MTTSLSQQIKRKPVVGYEARHWRLTQDHGPATLYPCWNECGRVADSWAYDHGDSNELKAPDGRPYSLSDEFYVALCHECHTRMDRPLADNCRNGHPRTPENTYVFPNGVYKACRLCRLDADKRWRIRGHIA